jgi:hypothetical protein
MRASREPASHGPHTAVFRDGRPLPGRNATRCRQWEDHRLLGRPGRDIRGSALGWVAHGDHWAVCVGHQPLTDGAEQVCGERAFALTADHNQLRPGRHGHKSSRRRTEYDATSDEEIRVQPARLEECLVDDRLVELAQASADGSSRRPQAVGGRFADVNDCQSGLSAPSLGNCPGQGVLRLHGAVEPDQHVVFA